MHERARDKLTKKKLSETRTQGCNLLKKNKQKPCNVQEYALRAKVTNEVTLNASSVL